jgi:molybdopterin-guanine dinucleotide biosynthesis protein A
MAELSTQEPAASDITEFQTAGIVLIGEQSRRMGSNKCSLQIDGRTLLQRVVASLDSFTNEVVVVGSSRRPRQ